MNQQQVPVFYVDPKGGACEHLNNPTLAYFIGGPLDTTKRVLLRPVEEYLVGTITTTVNLADLPTVAYERPIRSTLHKYVLLARVPSAQDISHAHIYSYFGPVQ